MRETQLQHIQVQLSGQDDNLGDTVLRDALLRTIKGRGRRLHIYLGQHSSDYVSGLSLDDTTAVYEDRSDWLSSCQAGQRPIHVHKPGEINPGRGIYPDRLRSAELAEVRRANGLTIIAGLGMKSPYALETIEFDPAFRGADLVSWRDFESREVAGFGEVNPDWAFMLGSAPGDWRKRDDRTVTAVTLRFDRPYPDPAWMSSVRTIARRTGTRIVTFAQVSRDAPRAVRLAGELGGEYWVPPSFSHDVLDPFVRGIFKQSQAVISDRAHGLIIAATEGALPVGSAHDPQKIQRLLSTAGLGGLVGGFDDLPAFAEQLDEGRAGLSTALTAVRARLDRLSLRINTLIGSVAW